MKNKRTSRTLIMLNIAMWSLVIISTCLHYQFNPFSFIWFDVIAPVGHFFAVVFSALSSFTVSMYELFKPETFFGGGVWFVMFVVPIICLPLYVVLLVLFAGKLSHHDTVVPPSYLK
ncbi:TPA: hypothetical protein ACU4ND_001305 [Haemophilus influenzae]